MQQATLTTPNTGIELSYRLWNDPAERAGKPPMLLVHGLASTMRIWDLTAPLLAQHFYVIAYDQRGHASSAKVNEGYDLDTMLADLVGLLDALDLQTPFVVGHSWGATLALGLAANYPRRASGIALVDGGLFDLGDMPGATWETVSRDMAPPDLSSYTIAQMLARMRKGPLSALPVDFLEEFVGAMMATHADGTVRPYLARENHMKLLRTIYDTHPEDLLPRITCPMLAVLASLESTDERQAMFLRLKPLGAGRAVKLARNSPRARVLWMEDTVHDIPLQRPEVLAQELTSFFQ
jgi:pimeloyl-ACP methyl ester carboxylesterase